MSELDNFPIWVKWWIVEHSKNIREIPGNVSNIRILKYHSHTSLRAKSEDVSWCSSAMCCAMEECGFLSTKSAAAISWVDYGYQIDGFKFGAIAVFHRDAHPGAAHVAIALREDNEFITVIGGNQKDSISIIDIPKKKLISYRWPRT